MGKWSPNNKKIQITSVESGRGLLREVVAHRGSTVLRNALDFLYNSRGHTTHSYLGKNDLSKANSPEIARGKFI